MNSDSSTNFPDIKNSGLITEAQDFKEISHLLDYLFYGWNLPAHLKHYAFALVSLTLLEKPEKIIFDAQIAMRMSKSRSAACRARKQFKQWQRENDISLIQIDEQEAIVIRDENGNRRKKHLPCKYTNKFEDLIFDILRRARSFSEYRFNWTKAIERACRELCDEVPTVPVWKERKRGKIRDNFDLYLLQLQRINNAARRAYLIGAAANIDAETIQRDTREAVLNAEKSRENELDQAVETIKREISKENTENFKNEFPNSDRHFGYHAGWSGASERSGFEETEYSDNSGFTEYCLSGERETDLDSERLENLGSIEEKSQEIDE